MPIGALWSAFPPLRRYGSFLPVSNSRLSRENGDTNAIPWEKLQGILPMWYCPGMVHHRMVTLACLVCLYGCSAATVSPGPTLLVGLKQYDGAMQGIGNSVARWPDRQRAGGTLKTIITGTVGASHEFYRLVDLDVKKREYIVTMRETSLRADRLQEMKNELLNIDEDMAALKPIIRSQMANLQLAQEGQAIEGIATRGLLNLALEGFSSSPGGNSFNTPSTNVNQYVVTDLGTFSTVRSPEGQTYRCTMFGTGDEGAGIKCEAAK